jgi:hypothetical protein
MGGTGVVISQSVSDDWPWMVDASGKIYQFGGTCTLASAQEGCTGSGWKPVSGYPGHCAQQVAAFTHTRAIVVDCAQVKINNVLVGYHLYEYNNGHWSNLTSAHGFYAWQVAVGRNALKNQYRVWSIDVAGNLYNWTSGF